MSEMLVMRRANGDLLTERIGGKVYIPIWRNIDAASRHKERNPDLLVYFPRRLDASLMRKITAGTDADGRPQFFLLSDDTPEAALNDGRPIGIEDVLPEAARV